MLVSAVLMLLRPAEMNPRTFVVAWFLSGPSGFLLWVVAWEMFGGGDGHVTASVGTTALLGWCAWHRGWYVAWVERRFANGITICVAAGALAMAVKTAIGNSTAPISLALLTACLGSALPLFGTIIAKSMTRIHRFAIVIMKATWRFLNRPVSLTNSVRICSAVWRGSSAGPSAGTR